jgi:hypothetical protein
MSSFPTHLHTLVAARENGARLAVTDAHARRFIVAFPRGQEMLRVARYLPEVPELRLGAVPRLGEMLLHVTKVETPDWHWLTESMPTDVLFAESRALVLPYKVLLETDDAMVLQSRIYL